MWLYQKKLTELESDFKDAKDAIRKIQKALENAEGASQGADTAPDRATIKLKLDAALALVRLIKEQTFFYVRLGGKFDALNLIQDIVDEFIKEEPSLTSKVLKRIDRRWKCGISHLIPDAGKSGTKKKK